MDARKYKSGYEFMGGEMIDEDIWYISGRHCKGGIRFSRHDYLEGAMARHGPTRILSVSYKRLSILVDGVEYIVDMSVVMRKGTYETDFIYLPYRFFIKSRGYAPCAE